MSIEFPLDGSTTSKILARLARDDATMPRAISKVDAEDHQYWTDITAQLNIVDSESPIVTSWRMREPFTLPRSWAEVGLFVGLAVMIQAAYWVIWPAKDDPSEDIPDNQPGGFPLDKINPMKRRDLELLKTQELNEVYLARQRQEEARNLTLQDLYLQKKLTAADIEQLMNDAAALQDEEFVER